MLELQYFTDENFCALNGTRKWTAGVQEIQWWQLELFRNKSDKWLGIGFLKFFNKKHMC